jgi:hypothetical protein
MVGVEPTLPKEHDFESCASANSATSAQYGVPGETRTPNLLIRSQTLYPVELRAHNIMEHHYGYNPSHLNKEADSTLYR